MVRWRTVVGRNWAVLALVSVCLAGPATTAGRVKVSFGYWNTGAAYDQLVRGIIDQFNVSQDEVEVAPEAITGNVREQVLVRTAAGVAPDITWWAATWYPETLAKGGFVNLVPYIQRDMAREIDDFFPPLLEGMRWEGGLYGLAFDGNPNVLFYNRDHFGSAGVTYPDPSWTWESLLQASRKLTVKEGDNTVRYGLTAFFGMMDINHHYAVIWSDGGELFDRMEQPTQSTVTMEPVVRALQWVADLRFEHDVVPSLANYTEAYGENFFIAGTSAMTIAHRGPVERLRSTARFSWDVALLPAGLVGRSTRIGSAGFSILSASKNPDAAWKFLRYMASRDVMARFTQDRAIPARISLAPSFLKPGQPPANDRAFIDSLAFGRTMPVLDPREAKLSSSYNQAVTRVLRGETSAQEAMERVKPVLDAILRE